MTKTKKPESQKSAKDYENLGRMLASIYETGYINRNQSYKNSFIKGVLGGLGGVIGATIVVALLLWGLSFFNEVPLIGPFVETVQNTIQQQK